MSKLRDLEKKLRVTFSSLSDERSEKGWPLFGLEHGLLEIEVELLKHELSKYLIQNKRMGIENFLVWIVAATEIGYSYVGAEYWQSFEREIKGWQAWGSRAALKKLFVRFSKLYRGISPQGQWAKHFSIISWPICNAILSVALQPRFLQFLRKNRFHFASSIGQDSEDIGRLASSLSEENTSTFLGLLEQYHLTGSLIVHLSLEVESKEEFAVGAICTSALRRICADIEVVKQAKSDLEIYRETQNSSWQPFAKTSGHRKEGSNQFKPKKHELSIVRPKWVAKEDQNGLWLLGINLHEMASILELKSSIFKDFRGRRMKIIGQGRSVPIERLRYLISLPFLKIDRVDSLLTEKVIDFDSDDDDLVLIENSVQAHTNREGLLLRVRSDGFAYEVFSKEIKPKSNYILVLFSKLSEQIQADLRSERLRTEVQDAFLYRFETSSAFGSEQEKAFAKLGMSCKQKIDILPIGLVPRWIGGSNSLIYVEGEPVLLKVNSLLPVSGYTITVNDSFSRKYSVDDTSSSILELVGLPIGSHIINVVPFGKKARNDQGETLVVAVKLQGHWSLPASLPAGFAAEPSPFTRSFQELKSGFVSINVRGLLGESCIVSLSLFDGNGLPLRVVKLGTIELPTIIDKNHQILIELEKPYLSDLIPDAEIIKFVFLVPKVGLAELVFEQQVSPVRMKLVREHGVDIVRLHNDIDGHGYPIVSCAYLAVPDRFESIEYAEACKGICFLDSVCCYSIEHSVISLSQAFVKDSKKAYMPLSALKANDVNFDSSAPDDLKKLHLAYTKWRTSSVQGANANLWISKILIEFELQLFRIVLGRFWVEKMWACSVAKPEQLSSQQGYIKGPAAFAILIREQWQKWVPGTTGSAANFSDYCVRYGVADDRSIAELVFMLALDPGSVPNDSLPDVLNRSEKNKVLWRGAFFAKTVVASNLARGRE